MNAAQLNSEAMVTSRLGCHRPWFFAGNCSEARTRSTSQGHSHKKGLASATVDAKMGTHVDGCFKAKTEAKAEVGAKSKAQVPGKSLKLPSPENFPTVSDNG